MADALIGDEQEYIYFIRAGLTGPFKIGKSKDVLERLATLQIGNAETLYLACAFRCDDGGHEARLHKSFDKHRIRGEWFNPAPEILKIVETWTAFYKTRLSTPRGGARV